jgi:hypothetical protein
MSAMKFRVCVVLIGAMITLLGTRALAQSTCDTGCNFGEFYNCFHWSGCPGNTQCEVDSCSVSGCAENNVFDFCITNGYNCQYPACSWNVGCGCSNG